MGGSCWETSPLCHLRQGHGDLTRPEEGGQGSRGRGTGPRAGPRTGLGLCLLGSIHSFTPAPKLRKEGITISVLQRGN